MNHELGENQESSATNLTRNDHVDDPDARRDSNDWCDRNTRRMRHLGILWGSNLRIARILREASSVSTARRRLFDYLNQREWAVSAATGIHPLRRNRVLRSLRTLRTIISPSSEERSGTSSLERLWALAHSDRPGSIPVSTGFILEFIHLFEATEGKNAMDESDIENRSRHGHAASTSSADSLPHSLPLNELSARMEDYFSRYPTGLDPDIIHRRVMNRDRILGAFGAAVTDWLDHTWQIRNTIRDIETLQELVEIKREHQQALELASRHGVLFGITPYYLSLFDQRHSNGSDHAVRAQVLPSLEYVRQMIEHRSDRATALDFMGEHETSPIRLVTRRYPRIAILKPFNSCAQICVYCQRNWEIDNVLSPNSVARDEILEQALDWFRSNTAIDEVLITGGDPCVMDDAPLGRILNGISSIDHIRRIRIGTRTPVVLPMRWKPGLVSLLSRYHDPGSREVAVVTHVQHVYEITPDLVRAVGLIRQAGISVYNQQVFTVDTSRRFETAKLRKYLRIAGIDPYYTFNVKGKKEIRRYRVPIARLLQERKEEARLLPGLDRTDEPVFNLPRIGKNHLRAGQDHRLIMIRPDGSRVYEMDPWTKNIVSEQPYIHTDVPIHEYLETLAHRGEDIHQYRSIWSYY